MITPQRAQLRWRVLIVDDELAQPETAGGRAVRALAEELVSRGVDVVEDLSLEDGSATAGSDAGLHCILINWTAGKNDARSHSKATELLRLIRASNARSRSSCWRIVEDSRQPHAGSGDPVGRVRLAARGHFGLHRGPGDHRDGTLPRRVAATLRRLSPPITGSGILLGGARHQVGSPLQSPRSAACSSISTERTSSAPTWGSSAGDSARSSPTAAPLAKARSTRHESSAPTGPIRCRLAPPGPTGPSCRPASAISRSRFVIATVTSPSSRD